MMRGMPVGFGPIAGLKVGHAQDNAALTGCTVFVCEEGAVAACDVRGGAVGEREFQTLQPGHIVERIHALVLAGGSAFGLEAATGVMQWCEEHGIGFDVGPARAGAKERIVVPIVPAAILFDLRLGEIGRGASRPRHPDAGMGYAAAEVAAASRQGARTAEGNVGAGTGATVGKLFGIERAMKAGIGCWTEDVAAISASSTGRGVQVSRAARERRMDLVRRAGNVSSLAKTAQAGRIRAESGNEVVRVAALAAVNAFGDIRDPDTGRILAGARVARDSREFADTAACLKGGRVRNRFADPNTVLVAVATNAALTRIEAHRVAVMASAGVTRVVSPAHTMFDGDVVFALSVGKARADVNALGAAAAEAVAWAIVRGVTQARSAGGVLGIAG